MKTKTFKLITSIIFTIVLFYCNTSLQAQNNKISFEKFGVKEGLPEEYVSSMVQDDQGFIWATTQNGLVKFDGYKIKVIRGIEKRGDSTKLKQRNFNGGTIKSKDGKIWFGAFRPGGIASYDPKTEKFRNYIPNPNDLETMPFAFSALLFEDSKDNIWFANRSNSLDTTVIGRLDTKTHIITTYPYKTGTFKFNDIVLNFEILEAIADNSVWIKDDVGNVRVLNREKDEFELVIPSGSEIPGSGIMDTIQGITRGYKDHFLMSSNQGLYIWDPVKRKSIMTFTNNTDKDNMLSSNNVNFAFEDLKGQFWVIHNEGVITIVDPAESTSIKLTYGKDLLDFKKGPEKVNIFVPISQNLEGIWFQVFSTSPSFFVHYQFSTKSFQYFDANFNDGRNQLPTQSGLYQVLEDRTSLLWLATRPNFYKQAPKTRRMEMYKHNVNDMNSIPSDTIYHLVEDRKQRLWIGTEMGLSIKQDNSKFQQFYFRDRKGLKTGLGDINKVYEDSKGQIWIGSNDHGLLRLNEARQEFDLHIFKNGITSVRDIQEDHIGNIWVSVLNQGIYILDSKTAKLIKQFEPDLKDMHGLLSNNIRRMFLDSKGSLWLGDSGDNQYGLFKYLEDENRFKSYQYSATDSMTIISNEIRSIMEDDFHRMWVGTDGGLCLYDRETDVFHRNNREFVLPSVGIRAKAGNGKMWVSAYSGGGLALVGPGINDVEMFGEKKGLLHNDVNNVVMDDLGHLWLPTQRGLSVLDTLTKTYTNFYEKDGYQKYGRSNPSVKTKNGDIWIGGRNGLNKIVPRDMYIKDSIPPAVLITSMGVLDSLYSAPDGNIFTTSVSYTDQIKLKYWQKDLSFDFVALHYLRSEDNLYSWKLENYDSDWTEPSKARQAKYTNLSPGRYTFRVKASNADGIWNEEGSSIQITILPPWWFTWWAYLIYLAILGLIGIQVHKYQKARTVRKERENAQKKELKQAKEIKKAYAELKATQSQLIQSEKMASLGELTAGIAHEIQNPLNFVNNFSEVNIELIEELGEEVTNGNLDEVIALAKDINENEQKINHHGKRADSIVKGMLQHSRLSNGIKEPTDINALADEYLRLAYHGLRAKDKSFNAKMETDFDDSISTINIVAQDMGRVILNLITNAFYVVQEKKSLQPDGYEPTVSVGTKIKGKQVFISIQDNGSGIPKKVLDKIFNPFFTTKPSGKGTGLGLSLSYDIVKAHGGELKVETKESEGTTFTIVLPANN